MKIPYTTVRNDKRYFEPRGRTVEHGFRARPLGPDDERARREAWALVERWIAIRDGASFGAATQGGRIPAAAAAISALHARRGDAARQSGLASRLPRPCLHHHRLLGRRLGFKPIWKILGWRQQAVQRLIGEVSGLASYVAPDPARLAAGNILDEAVGNKIT